MYPLILYSEKYAIPTGVLLFLINFFLSHSTHQIQTGCTIIMTEFLAFALTLWTRFLASFVTLMCVQIGEACKTFLVTARQCHHLHHRAQSAILVALLHALMRLRTFFVRALTGTATLELM